MLIFAVFICVIYIKVSQGEFSPQHSMHGANYHFQRIDALPREEVCAFAETVLKKVCDRNDGLIETGVTRASERSLPFVTNTDGDETFTKLFANLTSRGLVMRNLTLLMALVYLDRIAKLLKIYVNSRTLRKLLASSILVASKLHSNEVTRESLTELMEVDPAELLAAERCMVESIKDLTIHPQVFLSYCRPLMAAFDPPPQPRDPRQLSQPQAYPPQAPMHAQPQHTPDTVRFTDAEPVGNDPSGIVTETPSTDGSTRGG